MNTMGKPWLAALVLLFLLLSWSAAVAPSESRAALAYGPIAESTEDEEREEPTPTPTPTQPPAEGEAGAEPTAEPETEPDPSVVPAATPTPTPSRAYPIPDDQPADYALPNGHFFSQAVPGAPRGFGFAIEDAAGIPLWTEYQRLGGLAKLGYPTSTRFAWEDTVGQVVQAGVIRWRASRGQAEVVPRNRLKEIPAYALEPEIPRRLAGRAKQQPWSGWWWPAASGPAGPRLYDLGGPLHKYDHYVAQTRGEHPGTREWESEQFRYEGLAWAGHCNGWAAAALLEQEPAEERDVAGIRFSVADQKGLLAAYHVADEALWRHGLETELSPVDFHNELIEWLGNGKQGFILTFRPAQDDEVWSYPAYAFEMTMAADRLAPGVTHVQVTVWLADNNVTADFVGLRPWRGEAQVYQYRLLGPLDHPTGAEWEGPSAAGGFARPATIWYPDTQYRNAKVSNPNLHYPIVAEIVRKSDAPR